MKEFTLDWLRGIDGQIYIAKHLQCWGDKDKEKAKKEYVDWLKDLKEGM